MLYSFQFECRKCEGFPVSLCESIRLSMNLGRPWLFGRSIVNARDYNESLEGLRSDMSFSCGTHHRRMEIMVDFYCIGRGDCSNRRLFCSLRRQKEWVEYT
ncbi:hypothetical protein Ae201684_013467 [Aphanomyces euteiches]|uniref:Uncharacterized protein n=1 Tax=Aphanomyces euteiches TaxID=100861 RepID=A0A6G0WNF8_9STRA|nr:hypothetical protein Ae201684_013467 [Aphanomyces euteiches]